MKTDYSNKIAGTLNLSKRNVENVLKLLEEGATVPFIARYRKEMTGSMDEVSIIDVRDLVNKLEELDKRRETILKAIEDQGKLTPELRAKLERAATITALEDLYLPYKQKRKTRASIAISKGLEPLAKQLIVQNTNDVTHLAQRFVRGEVNTVDDALKGARDIIAEWVNENAAARNKVRRVFGRKATVRAKMVKGKEEAGAKFRDYFDFEEPLQKCPSHRFLAIQRGEEEGILRVSIEPPEEDALELLDRFFVKGNNESGDQVFQAVKDGYKRLMRPSIETEFRNSSKEKADLEAIRVFAENLRQLLLAAPLGQKRVLAIDPGYRSGCKIVCLNEHGDLLDNTTIYPHSPQNQYEQAQKQLRHMIDRHQIDAIAVGNGTASRESEQLAASVKGNHVEVFMVSENGASVYSASAVAREEFPDKDITVRGAVSIGRRLMDPLAELVKVDAKSIGVGQYQHDVDQKLLKGSLDNVVMSCVNRVGVNLNTASKHLLTYVSGLGPKLAQSIVDYRSENGSFTNRNQLKKVPRLGAKAFEQSAGFLKVLDGNQPLDQSSVHPESYGIVKQMAKDVGCRINDLLTSAEYRKLINLNNYVSGTVGLPTLKDILKELEKPGLDPRGAAASFSFSDLIKKIEDVSTGMVVPGIVTNITQFGCFVDIGVKQDGLVHISQLANKFVRDPNEVVKLHQQVEVKVMEVDVARNRINLSMKEV